MNNIKNLGLLLLVTALSVSCAQIQPSSSQARSNATCENAPAPGPCKDAPPVIIQFDNYGNINGVSDPYVHVCKNGKVLFSSGNPSFKDYGILVNRDIDGKTKKPGYWSDSATGETEVKISNKSGCVGYTIIRKLNDGSGAIKYLDPVFIIEH